LVWRQLSFRGPFGHRNVQMDAFDRLRRLS
jgi:hypothetical protein